MVLDFVNVELEEVGMCRCSAVGYCMWVVLGFHLLGSNLQVKEQMRFVMRAVDRRFLFLI